MKIIRTRQRPFLVVVDVFFTVLAWIGLLYLLVRGLWPLLDTRGGPRIDVSVFDALGTLQIYLWVALLNAVILISWARYQQRKSRSFARRRLPAPVVDDHGLKASFKLSTEHLTQLRYPGTMVIHNDEAGDVSHVVSGCLPIDPQTRKHLPPPVSLEKPKATLTQTRHEA
ncbi:poly-beta-1,6-N-acetyl-D-glucosamine biosynthesis protein PgaD [Pseudomonas sp. Irchel s3h17]|uniref:poly-beta-1,6-N-acetyl-D-glucosamine biosynthesis protein PgaD n=1 Tax=Pseudomonas sp. Irchel s3h17 TaxID=2009182 RepID=UPI000BA368D6|nr:poly-beta-1,6-N-acetyl-D-glucosamine biosynthesis protein PgaD [Pseudomonas sp. Irchel s3h17]